MSSTEPESSDELRDPNANGREISGTLVVFGMFAFGALLTGLLYFYWDLHTGPFRPLQIAIAEAFPKSQPRVIGGRYKSHKPGSPKTLRIVINVDFNPEDPAFVPQRDATAQRLAELAAQHHDVFQYDDLEIHLDQPIPEQMSHHWSRIAPPADWGLAPSSRSELH